MDEDEYIAHCPVCGDPYDYCRGHGEIGDPVGFALLQRHETGDHTECHEAAECEEAA